MEIGSLLHDNPSVLVITFQKPSKLPVEQLQVYGFPYSYPIVFPLKMDRMSP